ncbi:hypothetical protein [Phenylobacterium hankyongense]|uniref:hypothetical protein n=1 Tax=Phenylobacterium hankyongense TaxID=1813876 RepID=UPI001A9EEA52|nr:hypothetical protein [Phenylobacterium hankyongense]
MMRTNSLGGAADGAPMPFGAQAGAWEPPSTGVVRLPELARLGVQLLVVGSLFTGLPGPAGLGELRAEGALIGSALIVLFAALSGVAFDARGARAVLIFLPLAACILLSYAINADEVATAHFLGRQGPEKFLNSLLVLGFYLSFFYSLLCIANVYGVSRVLSAASAAARVAALLLVLEMGVEIVTWFVPPLRDVWSSARHMWAGKTPASLYRLVGFAPEPSFAAITALGFLGLLAGDATRGGWRGEASKSRSRLVVFLIVALVAFELLANSRTFFAGAFGAGLAWLLIGPARRLPASLRAGLLVLAPLALQAVLIWAVVAAAPGTRSVSNITRSVGMVAATQVWSDHPLLGVGLGQYGFHFRGGVPSWGVQSWEVSRYFRTAEYDKLNGLPPSFSLFTRLGAELGLIGFLAWILPPMYAIRRALILRPGPLTSIMVFALVAQVWTGLSLDSFRNVYYWLWLACLLAWPGQNNLPFSEVTTFRRREVTDVGVGNWGRAI